MSGFGVSPRRIPECGGALLCLSGELDISGAQTLREALIELDREPPPLVILDLRELEFIDSSGLRIILAADDAARHDGRRMALVEGPEVVQNVFKIARLEERLLFVRHPDEILRTAP